MSHRDGRFNKIDRKILNLVEWKLANCDLLISTMSNDTPVFYRSNGGFVYETVKARMERTIRMLVGVPVKTVLAGSVLRVLHHWSGTKNIVGRYDIRSNGCWYRDALNLLVRRCANSFRPKLELASELGYSDDRSTTFPGSPDTTVCSYSTDDSFCLLRSFLRLFFFFVIKCVIFTRWYLYEIFFWKYTVSVFLCGSNGGTFNSLTEGRKFQHVGRSCR